MLNDDDDNDDGSNGDRMLNHDDDHESIDEDDDDDEDDDAKIIIMTATMMMVMKMVGGLLGMVMSWSQTSLACNARFFFTFYQVYFIVIEFFSTFFFHLLFLQPWDTFVSLLYVNAGEVVNQKKQI